jgi:5'-3' exonuclease
MDEVCFEWYYPFSLPPLWDWLSHTKGLPVFSNTVQVKATDISPTEQLALVLPLESWFLLPSCPQQKLPYRAPHLFPTEFSFDSVGKRFFWECESMIPIPTIRELKSWCS